MGRPAGISSDSLPFGACPISSLPQNHVNKSDVPRDHQVGCCPGRPPLAAFFKSAFLGFYKTVFAKTLQSHKNMGKVTRLNRTTILLDLVVLLNSFTLLVYWSLCGSLVPCFGISGDSAMCQNPIFL